MNSDNLTVVQLAQEVLSHGRDKDSKRMANAIISLVRIVEDFKETIHDEFCGGAFHHANCSRFNALLEEFGVKIEKGRIMK